MIVISLSCFVLASTASFPRPRAASNAASRACTLDFKPLLKLVRRSKDAYYAARAATRRKAIIGAHAWLNTKRRKA